jgi:4-alpha-glucanotransferase
MTYPHDGKNITGTALPLACLRSDNNCGCGEFTDLPALGLFCKESGLALIQLLPVNDTGCFSSPYSALSSVALNPLYLNLPDAAGETGAEFQAKMRRESSGQKRFSYDKIYRAKEDFLKSHYAKNAGSLQKDEAVLVWEKQNPWIKVYAVYKALKDQNGQKHFQQWPAAFQKPSKDFVDSYFMTNRAAAFFFVWIQYLCDRQFSAACAFLREQGLALKGDLPILMNEDSADVWAAPNLFDTTMSAGAPPDMFSITGQNWGFPIYLWDAHRTSGFQWWKTRLKMAQKYYSAFRIDHVLGFFRIWSILPGAVSGDIGYFNPSVPLTKNDFLQKGFGEDRIRWLSEPHIPGPLIRETFPDHHQAIIDTFFDRVKEEDLFWFKPHCTEKSLLSARSWSGPEASALFGWFKDRTFIKVDGSYYPYWHHKNTKAYLSLTPDEKKTLDGMIHVAGTKSEEMWEVQGKDLLSFIQDSTDMLICAEDLGAVPRCVPEVLTSLNILGLKIIRWTRDWDLPDAPFIPLDDYPALSVATMSVHDTTTLRGWWEEEAGTEEKRAFLKILAIAPEQAQKQFSPELAQGLMGAMMKVRSKLLIFQIQDLLALDQSIGIDTDDRINVPGTVTPENWTYLLPQPLEKLRQSVTVKERIAELAALRKN